MKMAYYPGCSLGSTAIEYDQSSRAVCSALGLDLVELEDWSCCGATSAHNLDHLLSVVLPARNIALAQPRGLDVAVPCAACFSRLRKADHTLRHDKGTRREVEEVIGFKYEGKIRVLSLLEGLVSGVGLDRIAARVVSPLRGLKVVCYYGCLMVRPPEVSGFDRVENPVMMDHLVEVLGGESLMWSYKTDCCGAGLALTNTPVVEKLVRRLAGAAREAGASAIVTACPLCQSNLEMRQDQGTKIPSFYFTELVGMALGLKEARGWLGKHLVDPGPALACQK